MTAAGQSPAPALFFFLSFASGGDSDDALVRQFFKDLRAEVRTRTGTRPADPAPTGFLSNANLRLGSHWSEEIAEALGTCQTFVALSGPGYFRSEACGVEWKAFADRVATYRRETNERAPSLMPVCWMPTEVPPVAAAIQYRDHELSSLVDDEGLRQVMRIRRHRDEYVEFVSRLARHIVGTARRHRLPTAILSLDYATLPRAFPGPVTAPPPTVRTPRPRPTSDDAKPPELDRDDEFPFLHGI